MTPLDLLRRPSWHAQAACTGMTDLMYDPYRTAAAKAVCRSCGVAEHCLAAALARKEPDGVWGGLTTDERDTALRQLKRGDSVFQVVSQLRSSRRPA